jgi:hypothetical protein
MHTSLVVHTWLKRMNYRFNNTPTRPEFRQETGSPCEPLTKNGGATNTGNKRI